MTISVDESKIESCCLTDEKCIGGDCDCCQILKYHDADIMERLYSNFNIPKKIYGIPVMSNRDLTIANIDMDMLRLLQEQNIISKTESPYCPATLKQYNHHDSPKLRLFRKYNNRGIPDHIWAKKDYPAAFQWGDSIYIIAPIIELQ